MSKKTPPSTQPRHTPGIAHGSTIGGSYSNMMTAIPYTLIQVWRTHLTGDGQFNGPVGVAVDSAGNEYVTDTLNNRIHVFSLTR
ncbi:MAG: hypothetical protein WA667_00510 [Candidatus Nitrosopolaris sp.]